MVGLDDLQRVSLAVVVALGFTVGFCLLGYYLWAGVVVQDALDAPFVPDATVRPTVDPYATPYVPRKEIVVEGETSFNFNGITKTSVIQREYRVTNSGGLPVVVSARAVCTEGATVSVSWDKTTASLAIGESATFKLSLVVSADGACVVNFDKS